MNVIEYSTHFKIKDPGEEQIDELITRLSTKDFHTNKLKPFAYFKDEDKDVYRVPKGIGKKSLSKVLGVNDIKWGGISELEDKICFDMVNNPFEKQTKVINGVIEKFDNNRHQAIIDMPTGRGKTFTGVYLTHKLERKPLIFVSMNKLQNRWVEDFLEHTELEREDIYQVNGKSGMQHVLNNGHKYCVFIVTHATIRSFIKRKSYKKLNEWFKQAGVTLKIYDEFDTEAKNMFDIDCHTTVPYTLYLSATTFRSSTWDDRAFQYAFNDVFMLGSELFEDETPNRNGSFVFYNSNMDEKEEDKCNRWRPIIEDGEVGDWQEYFDYNNYHEILMDKDNLVEALKKPVMYVKQQMRTDIERKHIFCVGRIKNCPKLKKILSGRFKIDEEKIGLYHSKIDDKDKPEQLSRPIVITLTSSLGRGVDIDKLKTIIDMEAYSSGNIFKQLVGRVGRIGGIKGEYIKMVDLNFDKIYFCYKGLKKYISDEFDEVQFLKIKHDNVDDEQK